MPKFKTPKIQNAETIKSRKFKMPKNQNTERSKCRHHPAMRPALDRWRAAKGRLAGSRDITQPLAWPPRGERTRVRRSRASFWQKSKRQGVAASTFFCRGMYAQPAVCMHADVDQPNHRASIACMVSHCYARGRGIDSRPRWPHFDVVDIQRTPRCG